MAKIIMVQGTASGVGKSIFCLALCRIFRQDGFTVAPFKSQNMTSNCHVLKGGHQISRSQALAAYACKIAPSVDINPVLLVPNNGEVDVIVRGRNIGKMSRLMYMDYKKKASEQAFLAFNRLADKYDIVVIEGAGSPVEMNLIENDFVNMGFAQAVKAPVLLIADINRGGVFASLYGTVMLLTKKQRRLIKGLIINKFMGNISNFDDGKNILQQYCQKPVLGIVPYLNLRIEDEDCLSDFENVQKTRRYLAGRNICSDDVEYKHFMNKEFDKLAEHIRSHIDMPAILKILDEEISYE